MTAIVARDVMTAQVLYADADMSLPELANFLADHEITGAAVKDVDGLLVGVVVSILQTVTSIQDNILSFIPRAAAIFVVFALTFPWMLSVVTTFAGSIFQRLPDFVR